MKTTLLTMMVALSLATLTVQAQIDLVINSVTLNGATKNPGEPFIAQVEFRNTGTANSTENFWVGAYISTSSTFQNTTWLGSSFAGPPIANNASETRNMKFPLGTNFAPGNYYIYIVADNQGNITEVSENNNTSSGVALTLTPYNVDLAISNTSLSVTTVTAGDLNTIFYDLSNLGTTTGHSIDFRIYLADTNIFDIANKIILSQSQQVSIAGGNTFVSSRSVSTTYNNGKHYVFIEADYSKRYNEANETNNIASVPIVITGSTADLTIASYQNILSTALGQGAKLNLGYKVKNNSLTHSVSDKFYTSFYLSTDNILDASDVEVSSNISSDVYFYNGFVFNTNYDFYEDITIPENINAGTYYVIGKIDSKNNISEINEANNVLAGQLIQISTAKPDFTVNFMNVLDVSNVKKNKATNINFEVKNLGNKKGSAFTYELYLSDNNLLDNNDISLGIFTFTGLIPAANSNDFNYLSSAVTVTIPSRVVAGNFYIIAKLDNNAAIDESNESNNTFVTSQFAVGEATTGIVDDVNASKITLYPNPATNQLHWNIVGNVQVKKISIYSIEGKPIDSFDVVTNANTIDISSLPKGTYIVKWFTNAFVTQSIFVK